MDRSAKSKFASRSLSIEGEGGEGGCRNVLWPFRIGVNWRGLDRTRRSWYAGSGGEGCGSWFDFVWLLAGRSWEVTTKGLT